ncbi:MAG: hypothetical protein BWY42_00580 [Candidatus Omnitrophica bacterium ADurb.Bin277]|nr:MAG: hypothetical protein BWY42_00580 [Candidatus Omnitrophica bacterium ADurb.Bin277]
MNIRKLAFISILLVIFAGASPVSASETSGKVEDKKPDPQTVAEFEAMKSEWQSIRDRQILMIQEKEDELERLKEELFRKVRQENITGLPAALTPEDESGEKVADSERLASAAADPRVIESFEQKIADLKEANRKLAAEISELRAKNREFESRRGGSVSDHEREELRKEKEALDAQKAAFQKERKKFFEEMARQRERLLELREDPAGDGPQAPHE